MAHTLSWPLKCTVVVVAVVVAVVAADAPGVAPTVWIREGRLALNDASASPSMGFLVAVLDVVAPARAAALGCIQEGAPHQRHDGHGDQRQHQPVRRGRHQEAGIGHEVLLERALGALEELHPRRRQGEESQLGQPAVLFLPLRVLVVVGGGVVFLAFREEGVVRGGRPPRLGVCRPSVVRGRGLRAHRGPAEDAAAPAARAAFSLIITS